MSNRRGWGAAAAPAGASAATPAAPAGGYAAEDVVVRQFGQTVVLNFKLVQHKAGQPDTSFRNAGVFVLRDGRWQVASWRAGIPFLNAAVHRDALANTVGVYQQARVTAVPGVTDLAARSNGMWMRR